MRRMRERNTPTLQHGSDPSIKLSRKYPQFTNIIASRYICLGSRKKYISLKTHLCLGCLPAPALCVSVFALLAYLITWGPGSQGGNMVKSSFHIFPHLLFKRSANSWRLVKLCPKTWKVLAARQRLSIIAVVYWKESSQSKAIMEWVWSSLSCCVLFQSCSF